MYPSPIAAFDDIVSRNVVEIRKYGFNEASEEDDHSLPWLPIQFWEIVKGLANMKSVSESVYQTEVSHTSISN